MIDRPPQRHPAKAHGQEGEFCDAYIAMTPSASAQRGRLQPELPDGVLSRSFEMRQFSNNPKADGETDFRSRQATMDTEERVAFLRQYADYAKGFFNDPKLNTPAATDEESMEVRQSIKPQPLPSVRKVMPLVDWKFMGFRDGQDAEEQLRLDEYLESEGTSIVDGKLVITEDQVTIEKKFEEMKWRFMLSWTASVPNAQSEAQFMLYDFQIDNSQLEVVAVGFNADGRFFYRTKGETVSGHAYEANREYRFKLEVDLDPESRRYNFFIDDKLVADFVELACEDAGAAVQAVNTLYINGSKGLVVNDIFGQAFEPTATQRRTGAAETPFSITTVIDDNFTARPSPNGFETAEYDDSKWLKVPSWPYAHGGERQKNEKLYLRQKLSVGTFEKAILKLDGSRPSGRLFINGKQAAELTIYPEEVDVTSFLQPDSENLIAVVVDERRAAMGPHAGRRLPMGKLSGNTSQRFKHSNSDPWTGWYAGLMELHLTTQTRIDDVFAHTTEIGKEAKVQLDVRLAHDRPFEGTLLVEFFPWHPEASEKAAATARFPLQLAGDGVTTVSHQVAVPAPKLWSPANPNLYKIQVTLQDKGGKPTDDAVITSGLRTVSQEGGTFRINGQPEMLLGPLVFQNLHPIENISRWIFCPPDEWIVKQILMIQNQGGNAVRMSVHDAPVGGYNDVRWAQIADQMGIMLIWQTTAWMREMNLANIHLPGLVQDVASRRNHPSIVIWQPANHIEGRLEHYAKVFDAIYEIDPSRLISPNARMLWNVRQQAPPPDQDQEYPFWTHPKLARGTMEQTTGYNKSWVELRLLPMGGKLPELRVEYLNSQTHAWFDFENEESIGQPNWSLHRGKPTYRIYSYERTYDRGTIGRILEFDEWEEHQAYQAFSAYEAYRKKRWLGFDGLNWCSLRGGPNTSTYMKPMVDYYDAAKLAYHTVAMSFQRVLAGSRNVDTVYGPNDEIPVMVLNLGPEQMVNVEVIARAADGSISDQKKYSNVKLPGGRSVTDLDSWKPTLPAEGIYAFEYTVSALK